MVDRSRVRVVDEIENQSERGKSVVVVSHVVEKPFGGAVGGAVLATH